MHLYIFLKKSFLFHKIYVKIKISLSKKSEKGNSVGIVDKGDYLDKIEIILNKHGNVKILIKRLMEFWILQEKRVDNIFKKLVASNSISEETRKPLIPVGSGPCITYGLCKVHKDIIDNPHLFDLLCWQLILLPIN